MLRLNTQFVNVQLIPTLDEILTDMTSLTAKKGSYLKGLLYREPITNYMRQYFKRDYFELAQPVWRPFREAGEEKYQDQLLDSIAEYLRVKTLLTGSPERVKNLLFPTEDKKYGQNAQLTRQIRLFSYWIVRRMEKNTAKELIGDNAQKQEDLANGKLKVVYVNGKPEAVTAADVRNMSLDQIDPMVERGLLSSLDQNAVMSDFDRSEMYAMSDILEAAGLEVIDISGKDERGIITVQVEDVNHQKLSVKIDTNVSTTDSSKFEFTFTDDPINKESFSLSQKDLSSKFLKNGERVGAAQVARDLASAEVSGPKEKSTRVRPEVPNAIPTIPGSGAGRIPQIPTKTQPSPEQESFNIPTPVSTPLIQTQPAQTTSTPGNVLAGVKKGFKDQKTTKEYIKKTTKGLRPATGRVAKRGQPAAQQRAQTPLEAKRQTVGRNRITPGLSVKQRKPAKKGMMGKIIIAGAGGTVAAGPAIVAASYLIGGADSSSNTVSLILHCFGISCLA